ncbi:unnamed protein product, partial [Adineta steineri]
LAVVDIIELDRTGL